ncbi:hypothetical protein VIOR3934_00025 [Vibrio orientalis CIP 102891 = ATCC 33934]|uniref:Outer membrane protein beta-barrel domain-containing protein n=1 Tax=Vibrio orientalis CIP 102891 = ATCC 33934 TaxID=675816 RepID=C9QHJ8_VIBOR|nr:outer membrane beta-barrel protein [Vibrio orientalis]EEX93729.1 hypothetical protein VIA_000886 [Vibrio orientalis CIP 102891 = ATCC 33934]EGU50736.1 hypothetical protein VIOR3934_00025 [Vibrio orientalis CIP 102891 = ATCC 33934]
MRYFFMLISLISFSALAVTNDGPYIGIDYLYSDINPNSSGGWDFDNSQDSGFLLSAGYNIYYSEDVSVVVEGQYYSFGQFDLVDKPFFDKQGTLSSEGYFINFAPKYYLSKRFAVMVGVALGLVNTQIDLGNNISDRESSIKYSLGASYRIFDQVDLTAGVSSIRYDFNNILSVSNEVLILFTGLRYQF